MQNELAIIPPSEWEVMTQQADFLVKSGFLPSTVNSVPKAIAIMSLGRELGIGAWAALSSINVIQGKPTISPQLMLALINRSGQLEDLIVDTSEHGCQVTIKRKGRSQHSESFTMSDAGTMGLIGKDNWKKQPVTMMKWRAVAACARVVFPDVILGLYTPEEMGANVTADEQGNMSVVESTQLITIVKDEAPQIGQRSDSAEMPANAPIQPAPASNLPNGVQPSSSAPTRAIDTNDVSTDVILAHAGENGMRGDAFDELAGYEWHDISAIKVVPLGKGKMALLRIHNTSDTISMFSGDKLRDAGYDTALVDSWFHKDAARQWTPLIPMASVQARLVGTGDNSKWEIADLKQAERAS